MELVSNDCIHNGSVIRSRNQNGSCSSNGDSVLPLKWKPRKVSAVRHFPRECGPIVQIINVDSHEANPSFSLSNNNNQANDSKTTETQVESLPDDVSKSTEDVKVESIMESHKELQKEDNEKESTRKMKFTQRRVSAKRKFPPYCGLDATEPSKEERIRINGKRKNGKLTVTVEESNNSFKDESLKENLDPTVDKVDKIPIENGSHTATEIIQKVCQDIVVYTPDNDQNKRSSTDAYDEDSEGNTQEDSSYNSELPIKSVAPKNSDGQTKKVSHKKTPRKRSLDDINSPVYIKGDRIIVLGLMATSLYSIVTPSTSAKKSKSKKVKAPTESNSNENETYTGTLDIVVGNDQTPKKSNSKKVKLPLESNSKKVIVPKESKSKKVKVPKESNSNVNGTYTGTLKVRVRNEEQFVQQTEKQEFPTSHEAYEVDVMLPPFGPRSSNSARNEIRETLRDFRTLCRKLLQGEEAKTCEDVESNHVLIGKRVDLTARKILQEKGKLPDRGKKNYGSIPGIEVGDEFKYRVELTLIGLHWPFQGGIDSIKHGKNKTPVAVSVVASGGYDNETDKPECLIYSGAGGIGKDKQIEDQKLERGNAALRNNIELKIPVRVIRGYKSKSAEPSSKSLTTTYIYDGLYTVEKYWQETAKRGNLVFKFELKRIPGQSELALREVKSKNFKMRVGLCVNDITNGKEKMRIPAVNTINDKKPPNFNYITEIVYPDGYGQPPPTGCDCVGRCSGKRCKCAAKNGGELPYNHNGAIVDEKPLVYECGPTCKCGPSCYNRVTQNGMKIQLEIFKTETRGWGVRSLSSISSGSFICEYTGELLEDAEAEKRKSNDEYLFDIGRNYSDPGMRKSMDSGTGGFTIDAVNYGNVGRFINHSCSPNLFPQNVLYDQEDKGMPRIMFFAGENIPPLTELTYHYNYAVDTVHDSEGNIKVKKCNCGSSECRGRLY